MHERHYASIERLCKGAEGGFALKDLPKVQQVCELTFMLLRNGVAGFLEPACMLLRTLSKPFVKTMSTDELKLLGNAESMLRALGIAVQPGFPPELQLAVAEMLQSFVSAQGRRPSALELAAAAQTADTGSALHQYLTNNRLVVGSGVASAVLRGLASAILDQDEVRIMTFSNTLLSFSYLPSNCSQLVAMGVLATMPVLLGLGYKHDITAVAVELLWNVLEQAPEAKGQVLVPQPTLPALARSADAAQAQASSSGGGDADNCCMAEPEAADVPQPSEQPPVDSAQAESASEAGAEAAAKAADADGQSGAGGAGASGRSDALAPGSTALVRNDIARALTELFVTVLGQGFREVDKELRNNALVVLSLVLDASPEFVAACHGAGLFSAALAVACAPEVCSGAPHIKPWALTTDEIDLEVKMLCWNVAATGCALCSDALDAAKAAGFVALLLQYVDVVSPPPAVCRWNADRVSSLRSAALTVLHRLGPLVVDQYLSLGGSGVLLSLLTHCPVPVHVEAALRHLHVLVCAAPEMAEVLGCEGATPVLLDLVQGTMAAWPEGLRQAALQLVALLCSVNAENRRRLRKAQGLTTLLAQLSACLLLDPTLPSPLALAVLDAVWSGVVPDRKNVARFLVADGMDMLLSLLERGNRAQRPTLLSVLADLLENPRAHPFLHEWRSDVNNQTAAHMLVAMWKEEDGLRGMTVDGVLANTGSPLRGLDKRTRWIAPESVAYGNLLPERRAQLHAIMDACTGDRLLAKIYMVCKLVGFGNVEYLSLEDQASLVMIEKYVKFRQGEVWRAIKDEFDAQGMRPTRPDRERLESGIELSEALARAVRDVQTQLLGRHVGAIREREDKFFGESLAQRTYEREMRFFNPHDMGQMSIAELRAAKQKKEDMLRNSLSNFHVSVDSLNSTLAPEAAGLV